jgi:hypothetical protein
MSARTDERYPELRDFTERLLLELREVHPRQEQAWRAGGGATAGGDRRPLPERRRVRRRRAGLVGAGLAAGLVALLVAGVVLPRGAGGPEAAKAAAFDRAASPARNGPYRPLRPGEYWYTRTRTVTLVEPAHTRYAVQLPLVREVWMGTDGTARIRVRSGTVSFPSADSRKAWIADGKPDLGLAYRTIDLSFHGVEVEASGMGFAQDSRMDPRVTHLPYTQPMALANLGEGGRRTYYQAVASLPTDPDALERKLRQLAQHGRTPSEKTPKPTALELRLNTYLAAATLLNDESPAPPALRRALLQVLRHLPRVQVTEGVRDGEGRTGVGIRFDPGARVLNVPELIVDPATGLLLSERTTLPTSKDLEGRETLSTVYLQYGVVPSIRTTPAG